MPHPARGQNKLREYRYSQEGRVYFVTACTEDRAPWLSDATVATIVFEELLRLEKDGSGFELIA